VRVGEVDLTPDSIGNQQIGITLSDVDLRAGVQGVQVLYDHGGGSNVSPLVLHPMITKDLADNYEISVADIATDPEDGTHSATVTVDLAPDVGPRQQVALFLNEAPPSTEPVRAYTFRAESRTADSAGVTFKIRGVEAGSYLVRVQVAGAETLLETDGGGSYNAPQITIP
jgi:hypothetical protein